MTRQARDRNRKAFAIKGNTGHSKPTTDSPPAVASGRKWMFRIGALVLGPFLILAMIELGLRVAGYGYSTSFFTRMTIEDQPWLVENDNFGLRFFPPSMARLPPPILMRETKEAGAVRIFIFGESAALGDPRPNFGAGRFLEVLLRERFPATKFEVINTSVTAINSHVIRPIAQECAKHEGDIWIVYMGNNEMVGPFGAATVFGQQAPPLEVVRWNLALQKLRLGQLLASAGRKLRPAPNSGAWQGMQMFLQNTVPPGDARRTVVYESYRRNLEDIVQAGVDSGARMLLSTVAVNLRDCSPFATLSGTNLAGKAAADSDLLLAQGAAAENRGDHAAAEKLCLEALKLNPQSAEAEFRLGRCLARSNRAAEARTHFSRAVDLDALPFRADSRINGLAAELGRNLSGNGVALCDADAALSVSNAAGPGQESFYEHVHLNPEGNYHLARAWAGQVEQMLPAKVKGEEAREWISQERCERLLGLTDWNRVSILEEVLSRCKQPPLSSQMGNTDRLQALETAVGGLRRNISATPIDQARQVYLDALKAAPEDFRLRENYAEFLEAVRDHPAALEQRREVCRRTPHYYFSHYSLGLSLKEQGQFPEALESLKRAAALNPRQGEVPLEIGRVEARLNQWDAALHSLSEAARLMLDDPRPRLFRGEVLWKLKRPAEAVESLREAARLGPAYWEAHYRLGEYLALRNDLPGAAGAFEKVVQLNPGNLKAHVNLGVALAKMGRNRDAVRAFDKALELDPQNKQIQEFKRNAQGF